MSDLSPIMKRLVEEAHEEAIEKARGLMVPKGKRAALGRKALAASQRAGLMSMGMQTALYDRAAGRSDNFMLRQTDGLRRSANALQNRSARMGKVANRMARYMKPNDTMRALREADASPYGFMGRPRGRDYK